MYALDGAIFHGHQRATVAPNPRYEFALETPTQRQPASLVSIERLPKAGQPKFQTCGGVFEMVCLVLVVIMLFGGPFFSPNYGVIFCLPPFGIGVFTVLIDTCCCGGCTRSQYEFCSMTTGRVTTTNTSCRTCLCCNPETHVPFRGVKQFADYNAARAYLEGIVARWESVQPTVYCAVSNYHDGGKDNTSVITRRSIKQIKFRETEHLSDIFDNLPLPDGLLHPSGVPHQSAHRPQDKAPALQTQASVHPTRHRRGLGHAGAGRTGATFKPPYYGQHY